jgi:hypothetical protein
MREADALYVLLRAKVLFPEDLEAFRRVLAGVGRGRKAFVERAWEALERVGKHLGAGGPLGEAAEEIWPVMAYVVHAAEGRPEADLLAHRVARGRLPQA